MKKIVLTGGPCAGKTTALAAIEREFAGRVLVVPEVATMLLSGGFPVPGKDVAWSPEWQAAFQQAVSSVQPALENAYELKAFQRDARLLVCDRGLLDGAAYTPGGVAEFCRCYRIKESQAHDRYMAILHLESLATGSPEMYGQANNSARFESLTEAQALEKATRAAWSSHPNHNIIFCKNGIETTIASVVQFVRDIL